MTDPRPPQVTVSFVDSYCASYKHLFSFEDEYDLAIAVMDAVAARADRGGYVTQRFRFNAPERALINEGAITSSNSLNEF